MPIVTGCSAAWLAHLLWEQGVVGSNPTIPTKNLKKLSENYFAELFCEAIVKLPEKRRREAMVKQLLGRRAGTGELRRKSCCGEFAFTVVKLLC